MTDLAATRATQGLALTSRERWEVVMMHEALAFTGTQAIQHLLIAWRTQRHNAQHLSLTACKEGRTMCTRQQTDFARNRADSLEVAPINAYTVIQHLITHICL